MAKPIEQTPVLYAEDAEEFLKNIDKPASQEDITFMKEILEIFSDFNPLIED
jgi:hypothetical protein